MNFLTKAKLYAKMGWGKTELLRKIVRYPLMPVTWPMRKIAGLGIKGISKTVEGAEWATYTAREGVKGVLQMGVSPFAQLGKSRLTTVKRFLWDVPIEGVKAAVRTPIAIAKSPLELARGVRDSISSIPGNAKDVLSSIFHGHFLDAAKGTRKMVSDALLPPITRPIKPILKPAMGVVDKAVGAELQTATALKQAVTETVPEGARTFWHAPETASNIISMAKAKRELAKNALDAEKAKEEAALMAEIEGAETPSNVVPFKRRSGRADEGVKKKAA